MSVIMMVMYATAAAAEEGPEACPALAENRHHHVTPHCHRQTDTHTSHRFRERDFSQYQPIQYLYSLVTRK